MKNLDPEWERFKRKYPKFPGVKEYVRLLHRGNVQGAWIDYILDDLQEHAHLIADELIQALIDEENDRVRILLLQVVAEAGLHEATSILIGYLKSGDENLRSYAVEGLKKIDSKEARRALYESGNIQL